MPVTYMLEKYAPTVATHVDDPNIYIQMHTHTITHGQTSTMAHIHTDIHLYIQTLLA